MMATERTRVAGIESGDAPTAEQSIQFDARDRLAGRLDDTTVAQAAGQPVFDGGTPTPTASKQASRRLPWAPTT